EHLLRRSGDAPLGGRRAPVRPGGLLGARHPGARRLHVVQRGVALRGTRGGHPRRRRPRPRILVQEPAPARRRRLRSRRPSGLRRAPRRLRHTSLRRRPGRPRAVEGRREARRV
ncbi:MAG: hypothetical protein AVDCRST_MAG25-2807, partial [uncultured Rubrobacteraceae bacterium]